MGGSAGVCGAFQRAWPGLWSDFGLDRSSFLPPAATHQRHQVCHPLLLQEGDDDPITEPTCYTMLLGFVPNPFRVPIATVPLRSRSSIIVDQH